MHTPDFPFWRFSLELYRCDGVAHACIELQDCYGLNVNILLFCCFAGARHSVFLTMDDIQKICAAVERWDKRIVQSIRQLRRTLNGELLTGLEENRAHLLKDMLKLVSRHESSVAN